jgi:hypothetical protein
VGFDAGFVRKREVDFEGGEEEGFIFDLSAVSLGHNSLAGIEFGLLPKLTSITEVGHPGLLIISGADQ